MSARKVVHPPEKGYQSMEDGLVLASFATVA